MYANGDGVPQDDVKAAQWSRLAAEQGVASAQYNLGLMYTTGQGVPHDQVEAHMWLNLATVRLTGQERQKAVESRGRTAGQMTSDQLAEAQRRAREWTPTPKQ